MGRKRGWRRNNWAPRSVSPEPEPDSSPEPWDQERELSYEHSLVEQPYLGPYPIHHAPRYHHPFYSHPHPYYRHQSPDPAHDLVTVIKNPDHTSSFLSMSNRRWAFLDALKKAPGRIECWWPDLREDGTLKMEWKPEMEVVIPIPERGVGYSWGHERPERFVIVDLMNLYLRDFDFEGIGGGLGKRVEREGEEGGNWWDGEGDVVWKKEEDMDFKSEEEEGGGTVRMSDIPAYCPPPWSPAPPMTATVTMTKGTTEDSVYGFKEMMKWISGKQGPEVVEKVVESGGPCGGETVQKTEVDDGDVNDIL